MPMRNGISIGKMSVLKYINKLTGIGNLAINMSELLCISAPNWKTWVQSVIFMFLCTCVLYASK